MADVFFEERDPFSPITYVYRVKNVLYKGKSGCQEIVVFENDHFGRVLALDGVVQLTERDEFFYHEMLAQVALHVHPSPASVLIVGGGDGGTLREVLKHREVKSVTVVELDGQVIEVCKNFLPSLSSGFQDSRVKVLEGEGARFLAETSEKFDIILVDCTDPVGPAQGLFTDAFFQSVEKALGRDGIFVVQTESLHFHRPFVADVQRRLVRVFPIVELYTASLATYAGNWWSFSIASKKCNPSEPQRKCRVPTRLYSEEVHRHAFLPPGLRSKLISEGLNW
ncbi:MAG: polyamine aminopropyltransferase [Chloroflexi bacterium]|nr:polyamine aminopropyltransferase [Chloroflexota bacterium]